MAATSTTQLTDNQKRLRKHLDVATDVAIAYAAKEVPPLGNLTPEGLCEELGRLNAARKALEKTEKILKERIGAVSGHAKSIRSDNFSYDKSLRPRSALDQGKAKEHFERAGMLEEFMVNTEVETVTMKEL